MALGLAAVGYGLAVRAPTPSYEGTPAFRADTAAVRTEDAGQPEDPIRPAYRGGEDRDLELAFRHTDLTAPKSAATRLDLGIREQRTSRSGGGVELKRRYEEVAVAVESDGEPVDSSITGQVETLLVDTEDAIALDRVGRIDSYDWTSVTNSQVRKTLRMVKHAVVLATPRFRRGAVNVGESWSYRFVPDTATREEMESMEAKVEVDAKLSGVVERDGERLAVVEREFEVTGEGRVGGEGDDELEFELDADGHGRALFAIEAGRLVDSRVRLERRLQLVGSPEERVDRKGELRIVLREVEGGEST